MTSKGGQFILDRKDIPADPNAYVYRDPRRGGVMLKVLIGVGPGFLLSTNPEARQITGDLLRSAGVA